MKEEIKIESGIPIPNNRESGLASTLKRCKIGDSFIWTPKSSASMHASASQLDMKIATRKQPTGEYRIWRIG